MTPIGALFLLLALLLGWLVFRLAIELGWHWGLGLVLGSAPVGLTLLFGMWGLLGSAVIVGTAYTTSAR